MENNENSNDNNNIANEEMKENCSMSSISTPSRDNEAKMSVSEPSPISVQSNISTVDSNSAETFETAPNKASVSTLQV